MAHMKQEKIRPKGREDVEGDWVDDEVREWAVFRAADQKKIQRYMLPSKQQDTIPRESRRLSG